MRGLHRSLMITANSLLAVCLGVALVGCGGGNGYREVSDQDLIPKEDDHHHHEAPHGGLLVEVGSHEYNVEFVLADEEPRLKLYVLDAHAEGPVTINTDGIELTLEMGETKTPIPLQAVPGEGLVEGTASEFTNAGPLPEEIKSLKDLHGDLSITIKEKTYQVHVSEDGHDHDHHH